ncbi:IS66 family insertion sequence element accessory protein TnpB [Soonwooa purpurea]
MFALSSSHRFYLYDGFCDMRKSFDGLCGLISSVMLRQATNGEVFVFLNRSRTHMKLLHWEKGGFVLYYKRLESGTFVPPNVKNNELSWSDLVLMVEGIQVVKSIQKRRFSLT